MKSIEGPDIAMIVAILVAGFIVAVGMALKQPDVERQAVVSSVSPKEVQEKQLHTVYIQTVKHDGHMFVSAQTASVNGATSITHHPDCQCLRPKER